MVRLAALLGLIVCLLLDLMPTVASMPLYDFCGVDANWVCPKDINNVPDEVMQVCEACGNYWGNMPGFAFCCRCNEKIFGFCVDAVLGGK